MMTISFAKVPEAQLLKNFRIGILSKAFHRSKKTATIYEFADASVTVCRIAHNN